MSASSLVAKEAHWPSFVAVSLYRSESYFHDTPLIHPCKLDCGIPAADGLDNSFQIDIYAV